MLLLLCIPLTSSAGILFDDTDDRLTCGTADILTESGPFTISAWIKVTADATLDELVSKRTSTITVVEFQVQVVERLKLTVSGTTDLVVTTSINDIDGTWQHVLVHWDGTHTDATTVNIYIDGTEAYYGTQDNGGGSPGDNSGSTLVIGGRTNGANCTNGIIDEVAIWNVELTASEISQLANSRVKRLPLQIQPSNLQAYWLLDECASGVSCDGQTFRDLKSTNDCTGDDGTNNTGLTGEAEAVLSYP